MVDRVYFFTSRYRWGPNCRPPFCCAGEEGARHLTLASAHFGDEFESQSMGTGMSGHASELKTIARIVLRLHVHIFAEDYCT